MIYYNIKPIFILDSKKIIELKLDAVSKRLALNTKHMSLTRSNFDVLIEEVKFTLSIIIIIRELGFLFSVFTVVNLSWSANHTSRW